MRQKEWKTIITFHTTAEAIAMERACKEAGILGRLIPVPRQISAGCGLAWSMERQRKADAVKLMEEENLGFEAWGEYLV